MIHLTIMAEARTIFSEVVPADVLVRTKPEGTWFMINAAVVRNIVAFRVDQQMGLTSVCQVTVWVKPGQEASILRTIKIVKQMPGGNRG